uniref:Uncharacterized protein 13J3.03 n=1 Tax=Trypanosoma brucei TaxID=5691 RepID=Q8WPU6_9TRYP|nr:hypothetical protein [Trypanosoma brucei]
MQGKWGSLREDALSQVNNYDNHEVDDKGFEIHSATVHPNDAVEASNFNVFKPASFSGKSNHGSQIRSSGGNFHVTIEGGGGTKKNRKDLGDRNSRQVTKSRMLAF